MKVKNNTGAPQLRTNWRHVFLVTLHTIVLLLSAFSHDFRTSVLAPRALPQAFVPGSEGNLSVLSDGLSRRNLASTGEFRR
jgi:hypothetical protein